MVRNSTCTARTFLGAGRSEVGARLADQVVDCDAVGDPDVERDFCSVLGKGKGTINLLNHVLINPVDFVANHKAKGKDVRGDVNRRSGLVGYLKGRNRIPLVTEVVQKGQDVLVMTPRNRVLGTEGRFVEVLVFWSARKSGQVNVLHACAIRGSDDGADIMDRAHIMDDDSDRVLWKLVYLFG